MPHSYENYEIKSKTYTSLRKAVGIDYHLNHFSKSNVPLSEQILLDGGCGTGNYAVNFARKFKEIHCFDYSKGMLEKAKENMVKTHGSIPSNIYFRSGNICMLEGFHDNMFDSICVNQVLHHLRPDNDFEDLKTAISELYRVLKPGGRLGCFTSNYIDGKRLVTVDASSLPRMGITDFAHIQFLTKNIREMLGISFPDSQRDIRLTYKDEKELYLDRKSVTGKESAALTFDSHVRYLKEFDMHGVK